MTPIAELIGKLRGPYPTRQMHGVWSAEGSSFDAAADQRLRKAAADVLLGWWE
jgi:hypothetical protein